MKFLSDIFTSSPELIIMLRVLFAAFLGFFIGIDREYLHKSAGLRTFALISAAAAFFTTFSENTLTSFIGYSSLDPGRIASSVVMGIGFIGGGLILIKDQKVQGITTAAAMFMSTAIGMAVGFGLYVPAV